MSAIKWMGIAGMLAGATAACGGGGTGPSPDTLVGTWTATRAEFVNAANSAEKVELIGMGGSVTMTLSADQTYTMTVTVPGEADEHFTGTWSSSQDLLTMTRGTGSWQFDMSMSGGTLSLRGANGSFDVNDDGADEDVKMNFTLTKA